MQLVYIYSVIIIILIPFISMIIDKLDFTATVSNVYPKYNIDIGKQEIQWRFNF